MEGFLDKLPLNSSEVIIGEILKEIYGRILEKKTKKDELLEKKSKEI